MGNNEQDFGSSSCWITAWCGGVCASVSAVTCCPESPAYGLPRVAVVFCPLFGSAKSITCFSGEDALPMKNTFFF